MAVRFKHSDEYSMYYLTCTCFRWLNLFEVTQSYDCVYRWFDYLKGKKIETIAFVIMPNHFHVILNFKVEKFNLNTVVSNAKRFLAYEIVKRLEQLGEIELLNQLREALSAREQAKGQKHRVFEESFDAKPIYSQSFLRQKLNYIHMNPVRGKWKLEEDFTNYAHSSASFYELGVAKHFEPVHFKNIGNLNAKAPKNIQ